MSEHHPRRIRVIFNPSAGRKAGISTNRGGLDDMRALMAEHGLGDDLAVTASEDDAVQAARDAVRHGYDVVVAAGGDGTVGTVACELLDTRTALGVLPFGSVMNIARMLDLPRDAAAAAAVIGAGAQVRTIDVGEANGHMFFECGSVGINAAIFREAQRFDAGEYRSIVRGLWELLRYRGARMVLYLDDRVVTTRALMVTVANGPYTGIGFTVAPSARLDDGKFDVRIFRGYTRTGIIGHMAKVAFGRRSPAPTVVTHRAASVRIESRHPLPARADAFDLGETPVTFRVRPAALRVIVADATG